MNRLAKISGSVAVATISLLASTSLTLAQQTTLTFFTGNDQSTVAVSEAMAAAFEALHPDVNVEVEVGPAGLERDNMVKSRLATGTMSDVFVYNSGSLFQAINPIQSTVDLSDQPWVANVADSFKVTVTAPDGSVRGAPFGLAMGGGILYNIPIYEELGLSVPKTWDEFIANNDKVKEAGKIPVIQTFGSDWTSQIFILGDYYNVQAAEADFAERYTNNQAKFATSEAALAGFRHGQQLYEGGYFNEDFASATFEDGLRMIAEGEGAHYPMLTFALGTIGQDFPDQLNDVGYFGIPGTDPDKNGSTIWMPTGIYISANTPSLEIAKEFVAFVASKEGGCDPWIEGNAITGPFLLEGCELPEDVPTAVKDMQVYVAEPGRSAPALEFVSPLKGTSLGNIAIEVGSGIRSAEDAAAIYDEDVRKQAQQLALPGW